MPTVRLRITGNQDQTNAIIAALHGVEGIERVEEVDDLMLGMRDDSSSLGLTDDVGPGVHCVEVLAPDSKAVDEVKAISEGEARDFGVAVEFVDRF